MTAVEGTLIAAPSSSEMTAWKSRIAALEASDPERAELEITDALTFSNEMLRAVSDVTAHEPTTGAHLASAGIGAAKLTAVRAAEFSKRLDLSKDTVLEAQMQQRRWERALGVAIREGQERGEIRSNGQHASCAAVSSPSDYAKQADLTHPERGIYALTDNATDEQFEAALTEARNDNNVSRANVVRKLKEARLVDIATGEVYDPETPRTDEERRALQAERDRMMSIYTDASNFSSALNRLAMLGDPRHAENYRAIFELAKTRPDMPHKHHNPADIRRIAQYLTDYADLLENHNA